MNQGGWCHFFGKSGILIDELEVVVDWRGAVLFTATVQPAQ